MANWIESFAKKERVAASLCVSFAHHPSGQIRQTSSKPKGLTKLELVDTCIEQSDEIYLGFNSFFKRVVKKIYQQKEKQENELLK